MKQGIVTYWNETVSEIEKVTWPTKDELIGSTIVTIVVSLLLGFFIFAVDIVLARGVSALLGIG
jgi:preprotein translocase subunit SecE